MRLPASQRLPTAVDWRVSNFDQFFVGLPITLFSVSLDQCAKRERHAPAYDSMPANGPGGLDRDRDCPLTASEKPQTICSTPRAPTVRLTTLGSVMRLGWSRPG